MAVATDHWRVGCARQKRKHGKAFLCLFCHEGFEVVEHLTVAVRCPKRKRHLQQWPRGSCLSNSCLSNFSCAVVLMIFASCCRSAPPAAGNTHRPHRAKDGGSRKHPQLALSLADAQVQAILSVHGPISTGQCALAGRGWVDFFGSLTLWHCHMSSPQSFGSGTR